MLGIHRREGGGREQKRGRGEKERKKGLLMLGIQKREEERREKGREQGEERNREKNDY